MSRPIIKTDDGIESVENVADIAEMTPGHLQVVCMDESSEMISGSLFGGWGDWKMWLELNGSVEQHVVERVLTVPTGAVEFNKDGRMYRTGGHIKRLKRPNL